MGVKITQIVEGAKVLPEISRFAGKVVAIDAFNVLYSFLSTIRQHEGVQLMDRQGHVTSHLSGFFFRTAYLLEQRVKPVYIFDGKPPELKAATVAQRIEAREEARKKADEAREHGDLEAARKHAQASSRIEPYMIPETKELLALMGVPCIDAPSEAEAQATHMVNAGMVDVVSSQDYDCFLFGARNLLRNLTQQKERRIQGKSYPIEMEYYELDNVLRLLGLRREQIVDLGILVGTDFNEGVRGVGQKTALKLLQKHGSIEGIYEEKPSYQESLPLDVVEQVRRIFLQPEVEENCPVTWGRLQKDELVAFLSGAHDFARERVTNRLAQLDRELKKKRQQSLDSFMT